MTAAVIANSRRISAGIDPDPGASSRLRAWWGADHWLAEVADAITARDDLLRAHHVAADAVLAVAERMADHADFRTGRNCRPTNERLVELTRRSLSTVQRARRVLKELRLVVEQIAGRSIMTRAERLAAWRRGSSHRKVAATFALCSRSRRAPKIRSRTVGEGANDLGADPQSVDGDTPPGAKRVSSFSHLPRTNLRRRTENEEGGQAPRSYRGPLTGQPRGVAAGTRRLAEGARGRLGWLSGTSWRRLAPTLARFARAGWTPRDVDLAVRDTLAVRGWQVPRDLKTPAAYLAGLLRELDPADRPSVLEDAYAAAMAAAAADQRAARRAWLVAMRTSCSHGVPAGDTPHPETGARACRECRGAASEGGAP